MATYGTIQRTNPAKPRLEVLRGFNPNEPFTQSSTHPVKDGVTVSSGQLIVTEVDVDSPTGYVWILCPTGRDTGAVYIAEKDSEDEDIQSAGNLPGLSCAGQYEFEMAFFDGDASDYEEGLFIMPSATNAGNVQLTASAKPAAAELVIGQVSRAPGNTAGVNSNVAAADVITWRTVFNPATA